MIGLLGVISNNITILNEFLVASTGWTSVKGDPELPEDAWIHFDQLLEFLILSPCTSILSEVWSTSTIEGVSVLTLLTLSLHCRFPELLSLMSMKLLLLPNNLGISLKPRQRRFLNIVRLLILFKARYNRFPRWMLHSIWRLHNWLLRGIQPIWLQKVLLLLFGFVRVVVGCCCTWLWL